MKIYCISLLAYFIVFINTQQPKEATNDLSLCWNITDVDIITIYGENLTNSSSAQFLLPNNFSAIDANSTIEIINYESNVCMTTLINSCNDTSILNIISELNITNSQVGSLCDSENVTTNEPIIEAQSQFHTSISMINQSDIICTLSCRSNSTCETNGTLTWFTLPNTEVHNETITFNMNEKDKKIILPDEIWLQYLNQHVYCSFTSENETVQSENYYLGLIIVVNDLIIKDKQNGALTLKEDNITGLTFHAVSNVPLKCEENIKDCDIKLYVESNEDFFSVESENECYSSLNSNKGITKLIIRPGVYVENVFSDHQTFILTIKTISFGLINNLTLSLPQLKLTYIPMNRPLYNGGSCYNDPHCTTNDGQPFEFQYIDGEFLMYENKELQFRVHLISHPCVPGCKFCNYCIKEIYIQSIDDLVGFDIDKTPNLFYRDLNGTKESLPLLWSGNRASLPKSTLFSIYQDSYQYNIFSHYGTAVRIAKQGYFFQITPSKLDFGKVNGLLGNYNSIKNDDFGSGTNLTEFFMQFNAETNKLPQLSKGEFYNFTQQSKEQKYCRCILSENGSFEKKCENGPMKTKKAQKPSIRSFSRLTTQQIEITNQDLIDVLQFNKSRLETPVTPTQSNVSNCGIISSDLILKECERQGVINVTKLVEDCEIDFKSTNLTIWAQYYIETRRGWCKTNYEDDVTVSSKLTSSELATTLASLCLNSCTNSTYGTCVNGSCVCNNNFAGDDCSIKIASPPQLIATTRQDNLCDRRTSTGCNVVSLFGKNFAIDQSTLKIIYRPLEINNDTLSEIEVISIDKEIIVGKRQLNEFKSPKGTISVRKFSISVTNNKNSNATSEEIIYAIYDSKCHEVIKGNFNLKANTCDINGLCYNKAEKNPADSKQDCNPAKSLFDWSVINASNNTQKSSFLSLFLVLFLSYFLCVN